MTPREEENLLWRLLTTINKNLVLAVPAAMAAGFAYGLTCDPSFLKELIIPFTFLMVYPMMVTLKLGSILEGGDTRAQILAQGINFAIIPFVAFGIGRLFFGDHPYMALGLLLASLLPTSGMTISWTGFARGNLAAAVKMTVAGLIIGSLATPLYLRLLADAKVEIDVASVLKQILVIVFLPMLAGYATQLFAVGRYGQKTFHEKIAPRFPGLSTVGVLSIVFIAISLKARAIVENPEMLATILLPLLTLYLFNYLLSTLVGKYLLPRSDAIALVYGTVMRNLSIALAVAMNAFGKAGAEAALVIALAYIIQVQSAAWYVRLTEGFFGKTARP